MTTKGKPRKPPAGNEEELSVSQLVDIPLKRRLEILFASNIIPCRRQLALKYNLTVKLIHNVLSHRRYLLENWKYNADAKSLLSKLELENAMAMTELLIEWKRRVQLNGLQITDTALARKAAYLQRVLNGSNDIPSDKWWEQFDITWEYKNFQDYKNDSLEMEDILNDLQWMFSEGAFRRLMLRVQQAKNGQRLIKYRNISDTDTIIKTENSDEIEEYFDISDIKAEPHYYNDDDFDCEEYEFVLDEEAVIDALRKELEDSEQAKYKQYLLRGKSSETINQEGEMEDSEENDNGEQRNNQMENLNDKTKVIVTETVNEEQNSNNNDDNIDDSIDNVIEHKVDSAVQQESPDPDNFNYVVKIEESLKSSSTDSTPAATTASSALPLQPKQLKRKPRNSNPILSLRKDYVRMPAAMDIVQLARKQCLEQLLQESDDDVECNEDQKKPKKSGNTKSKSTQRRKNKPIVKKGIPLSNAASSSSEALTSISKDIQQNNDMDAQFNLDTSVGTSKQTFNDDSIDDVKQEMSSPMASDIEEFIDESSEAVKNLNATDINLSSKQSINAEQNNNDFKDRDLKDTQINIVAKNLSQSIRRTNRKTTKDTGKLSKKIENEIILDESHFPVPSAIGKSEMDVEEELSGTEIQAKYSQDDSYQPKTKKRRTTRTRKVPKRNHKKHISPAKSPPKQENVNTNAPKRAKRRTDDSDLTLRKDKVRLSVARVTSGKEATGQTPENVPTQTDVHMIFEPYIREN